MQLINKNPLIIAGPCSVESPDQIRKIARETSSLGIKHLRGGAFKPRTSPQSFQGLGKDGIMYMRKAADEFNMTVVTEVLDNNQLDECLDMIDIVQIGSRNMTSSGFLKYVGKKTAIANKGVLIKRGFSATINEFLMAAEYIRNEGNSNIILCLRGVRTFEQIDSAMRFTPDLASILELKEKINDLGYKVIFDPSHSTGNSKYVVDVAKAALVLGADGLIIECHTNPVVAFSDGEQSILPNQLKLLLEFIKANSINENNSIKV